MNGFEVILLFLRPIQHLILDPEISEIMVNGTEHVFIERAGRVEEGQGLTLSFPPALLLSGPGLPWLLPPVLFWLPCDALNSKTNSSRGTCLATPNTHAVFRPSCFQPNGYFGVFMHSTNRRPPKQQTQPDPLFEPLLDSDEAARLLRIHPKTLQKMARDGEIVSIHIGKLWRFRASDLNRWVQKIAS
jgi:excisionase family DNA binding protein